LINLPPLSVYIHYPWCVKKCPYCDFNSHEKSPYEGYVNLLKNDLKDSLAYIQNRKIRSIFFGGGTPSIMSTKELEDLMIFLKNELDFEEDIEITLEANPGTFEIDKFTTFHDVGINRLSIGVQSFHNQELERLGRIHNSEEAKLACYEARKIFNNINIDIMYGLPEQSVEINQSNLGTALSFSPDHISYYQLTIEPNTYFHKYPPKLPSHDSVFNYGIIGQKIIERSGLKRYEVSAYGQESRHNLNYWLFGDYIGIGAGAHGKITSSLENKVFRTFKNKSPKDYYKDQSSKLTNIENLTFDFMLNALRLEDGFEIDLFEKRTGIEFNSIEKNIQVAIDKSLLKINNTRVSPTTQGYDFLNDLQEIFL